MNNGARMNDNDIVRQRIAGCSVRPIAKAQHCSVAQVNEAIDRSAATAIDDKTRKLDELQEQFYARALERDVPCGALVSQLIERRWVMLGPHTPQQAVVQIVEARAPRERSRR
jgi:hypothetical protein